MRNREGVDVKTRIGFGLLLAIAVSVSAVISLPTAISAFAAPETREAFTGTDIWLGIAVGVFLHVIAHLVRSEKHALLLRGIRPIGRAQVFRGQMIGFMFNALLPFRVGELMRAHYIGRAVQISRAAVFATIILERCVDLVVVCVVGGVIAAVDVQAGVTGFTTVVGASIGLLAVAVASLTICYRQPRFFLVAVFHVTALLNERLRDRTRHVVWSFCHALRYAMPRRAVLVRYLVLSLAMWAAYLGSIVAIAVPLAERLALSRLLGLADAAFLGVTSWRGSSVLSVFEDRTGVIAEPWLGHSAVIAFALLTWSLLVVPSTLLGATALLHRRLVHHIDGPVGVGVQSNKLFRDRDTSGAFGHMLGAHFRGEQLGKIVSREEALGTFTVVRALKGGSHASTLLVWQQDRLVVKKITLTEHAVKLRSQYDWLQERSESAQIVSVVGRHHGTDHFAIDIEFREGYTSFFEHLHATSPAFAWDTLERILDFVDNHVYSPGPALDRRATLDAYIRSKAIGKLHATASASPQIAALMDYAEITVNGERLMNMPLVLDAITTDERAMGDLTEFRHGPIHGDLTIDNLMVNPSSDEFMVIDPNDENAISDQIVDYAKLLQSLRSGYEFLLLHDCVTVEGSRVTFEERKSAHYQYLYDRLIERLESTLSPARFRGLLFHEALHYCRMLTYRATLNPDSVALYYSIAVRLLNRFVEQYRPVPTNARALPSSSAREEHLVPS